MSAQRFEWVNIAGGLLQEQTRDLVTDAAGNTYVTGMFTNSATFGNTTVTVQGDWNAYLVRYSASGNMDWVLTFPTDSLGSSNGLNLALGPGGRLYLHLLTRQGVPTYVGSDTLVGTHAADEWVSRFDTSGNYYWTRNISSSFGLGVGDMCSDPSGNLILTGVFVDSVSFETGGSYAKQYDRNWYVAKYNPAGNFQWATLGGCVSSSNIVGPENIASDASGNLYLSGATADSSRLGNRFGSGIGYFAARVNANGAADWIDVQEMASPDHIQQLAVDPSGQSYHFTSIRDSLRIGGTWHTSSSRDLVLYTLSANGSPRLLRQYSGIGSERGLGLHLSGDSLLTLVGFFGSTLNFGLDTLTNGGNMSVTDIMFAKVDTSGNTRWVEQVMDGTGSFIADVPMGEDAQGNVYFAARYSSMFSGTAPIIYGSNILNPIGDSDILVGKINPNSNSVYVHAFRDWNNNSVQDAGESDFQGILLQVQPGSIYQMTDVNGNAEILTDSGSLTIDIPNPPRHYTVSPSSHSAVFNGYGLRDSNNVFALYADSNIQDLSVVLTAMRNVNPGRKTCFSIDYENMGTKTMSGQVIFIHDAQFTHSISTPAPASINGDTLTWNFSNLPAGGKGKIVSCLTLDTAAVVGSTVQLEAEIQPVQGDSFPADNFAGIEPTIRAAVDPNDKQVQPVKMSPSAVANGNWLNYTIRFQNTGTDTAFDVIVRDTLDANLDWTSIQMQAASHSYNLGIRGNRVTWVFPNILLPDSTTDEPGSHGFIRFRIKPKAGLGLGDEIKNRVGIYFDFAAPVITNTAVTAIDSVVAIVDPLDRELLVVKTYPNPSDGNLVVRISPAMTGLMKMQLTDIQGRVIRTWPAFRIADELEQMMDFSDLPNGLYLLNFNFNGSTGASKILIRR